MRTHNYLCECARIVTGQPWSPFPETMKIACPDCGKKLKTSLSGKELQYVSSMNEKKRAKYAKLDRLEQFSQFVKHETSN